MDFVNSSNLAATAASLDYTKYQVLYQIGCEHRFPREACLTANLITTLTSHFLYSERQRTMRFSDSESGPCFEYPELNVGADTGYGTSCVAEPLKISIAVRIDGLGLSSMSWPLTNQIA